MRIRSAFFALASFVALGLTPSLPARADDVAAVPDVVGKSRADATAQLNAEGFLVGVYEIAGDPPDTVAVQTPAANSALPRGGIVSIDVRRKHSDSTPTPKAIGLTPAAAVSAFGRLYDLRFEAVTGPSTERGKVIGQVPAEGQPLVLRGALTLRFVLDPSLPASVAVPDVTGLSASQAIEAIGVAGAHAQIVETAVPGAPADLVIGQYPLPGSEAPRTSVDPGGRDDRGRRGRPAGHAPGSQRRRALVVGRDRRARSGGPRSDRRVRGRRRLAGVPRRRADSPKGARRPSRARRSPSRSSSQPPPHRCLRASPFPTWSA